MNEEYDLLKLENQLCFPLYACSKEIIRRYKPYLDPLDLTYTQYITMMVMWEKSEITIKGLGKILYLDSGTLTPVLKKLETKGYITRERSQEDERNVFVTITEKGQKLKAAAAEIPIKLGACVKLLPEEFQQLQKLLHQVLSGLEINLP
ncbi:MarR family transcriptional regulator [Anaerotignum propionicum]|jgi:DNA-binding MarR family transcriptional regulator|uniref:MarR family winged helix-turn-helix transcriptional regulator n=1 Tax=Anaerotignum propionicum TaxID=28446 RepID=UPI002899F345|nr:MarR family transcriptional regulator [Anaerotignum propionicum]